MNLKSLLKESKNKLILEAENQKVDAYPIVTVTYDNTFSFEYDIDEKDVIKVVEITMPCSGVSSADINFSDEWMQKFLKDKTNFTMDSTIKNYAIAYFKKEKTLIDPETVKTDKLGFRVTSIGYEPHQTED